jgi:hypothetical protein
MNDAGKRAKRDTWTQRLMDRLFRKSDAAAVHHGWEVKVQPGIRGRIYRDPRFDGFERSAGRIGASAKSPGCSGTGRTVVGQRSGRGTGQPR